MTCGCAAFETMHIKGERCEALKRKAEREDARGKCRLCGEILRILTAVRGYCVDCQDIKQVHRETNGTDY